MKKILAVVAGAIASTISAVWLLSATPLPFVPNTGCQEANQLLNCLNLFVNQFNGGNGYTGTPQIVSAGSYCTASGATPQTCNGQRGLVTTASLSTAAATNANYVINNSLVTAASVCQVTVASYSGTLVTNGYPQPLVSATGTGTLTVSVTNTHAANALSGTVGLAFNCVN